MKKLFQIGAVLFGVLFMQTGLQADVGGSCCAAPAPAAEQCEAQPTNDCWCKYVRYEPCYYTTKRCVEDQIPCKKRCCRMVPQYYEVQRCKYVPQYYTETCCRQVPEYYEVDDCKTCKRWVCDQHCRYVPKYFWKHVCGTVAQDSAPAEAAPSCCPAPAAPCCR